MSDKQSWLEQGIKRSQDPYDEKIETVVEPTSTLSDGDEYLSAVDIQHGTKRGLSARHIQMISLGGAIG